MATNYFIDSFTKGVRAGSQMRQDQLREDLFDYRKEEDERIREAMQTISEELAAAESMDVAAGFDPYGNFDPDAVYESPHTTAEAGMGQADLTFGSDMPEATVPGMPRQTALPEPGDDLSLPAEPENSVTGGAGDDVLVGGPAAPNRPRMPSRLRYGDSQKPRTYGQAIAQGIFETAEALNVSPLELATQISYETGGTFNPRQPGPTTKWGQHRGLIQFGEPQARQYGVDWDDPVGSQLGRDGAIVRYLKAHGFQPGMSGLDMYSTINAGAPGRYSASDTAAGGAPGDVRDKYYNQMPAHRRRAAAFLRRYMES